MSDGEAPEAGQVPQETPQNAEPTNPPEGQGGGDSGSPQQGLFGNVPSGEGKPWYEGVLSEDLLNDPKVKGFAEKYKSVEEAIKGAGHLQSKIGEKGIKPPGPDSDPAEVSAFFNAIGRPEEPNGYEWEPPEGIQMEEQAYEQARQRMHEIGLTNDQYQQIMDIYAQDLQTAVENTQKEVEQKQQEMHESLRKEWGANYEKNLRAAENVANQYGLTEFMQQTGLNAEPGMVKLLSDVANRVMDDQVSTGGPPVDSGNRLEELKKHPAFHNKAHPEHKAVIKEWMEL